MIGKGKILMERTVVGWGQCIGMITPAKDLVEVFVRNQQWLDTIYLYVSKIQVSMYFHVFMLNEKTNSVSCIIK